MSWLGEQWRRLQLWRRRDALDRELADEMANHRELRADSLRREKIDEARAQQSARLRFGNATVFAEEARSQWGWTSADAFQRNVHFAVRQIRSNPGFAISAIASLALGIGSAIVVFAVLYSVVLRPLPYSEPERLAFVWIHDSQRGIREEGTSYPTFLEWKAQNRTFSDIAARARGHATTLAGPEPERLLVDVVSANFLPLLGVEPVAGRVFTVLEEARGELVTVISHRLAVRRFGSPAAAVGAHLEMDGRTWRVCGVMPPGFGIPPAEQDIWVAAWNHPVLARSMRSRTQDFFVGIGRLRNGVTVEEAQADLNSIGQRLAQAFPTSDPDFGGYGVNVVPLDRQVLGTTLPRTLWILLAAVGLVLLVACANVANQLLARGSARRTEFAIRSALGAGMRTLLAQQLTESVVLSLLATGLGLGLAALLLRLLPSVAPGDFPRFNELAIHPQVAAFAVFTCVVAAIAFGAVPSWVHARRDPGDGLKAANSRTTDRGASRLQSLLVIFECALAFVLVVGAGLFVRSLIGVQAVDPGFESRDTILLRVARKEGLQSTPPAVPYRNLLGRIRSLPGVEAAGAIADFFYDRNPDYVVTVMGRATESREQITVDSVAPGFLQAINARLRQGRLLVEADYLPERPTSLVINETFARRLFPGEDPVGKHLKFGTANGRGLWIEIVGVVADLHRRSLERNAVCEAFGPAFNSGMAVTIRTNANNIGALIPSIRHVVREVEPGMYIYGVTTLQARLREMTANRRLQAWSLGGLGLLTLLLAAVGIGGVLQFMVGQRRRELAIRLALGACATRVRLGVLIRALGQAVAGIGIGLALITILTRVIASLLFGISPMDSLTIGFAAGVLISVALAASWAPARAACRTNTAMLLRE